MRDEEKWNESEREKERLKKDEKRTTANRRKC